MSRASAPGSSANLGPGYDVLALALDLRCTVSVERASSWQILSGGMPADPGGADLVRRAASGIDPDVGPMAVSVESEIPLARGLGSSAALIVATAGAVASLVGADPDPGEMLALAAGVEGHPDNVAAAINGGLVAVGTAGEVRQLNISPLLEVLVAVPDSTLPTAEARLATADPVSTAVAARTAARLAMLIDGLATADAGTLAGAAGDELHEARRAHLSPVTGRLIEAAKGAGALHACWSGAGPSALAFVPPGSSDEVKAAMERSLDGGYVLSVDIDRQGLRIG